MPTSRASSLVTATKLVPIEQLRPWPENPRNGDIDAIVESLRVHGQYRAIVVRQENMMVLCGNHTYAALMQNGAKKALVHLIDCTEEQGRRIALADNRLSDLGMYDDAQLVDLLQGLDGDFTGTGWDESGLADLLAGIQRSEHTPLESTFDVLVKCEKESEQKDLIERLSGEGYTCKALGVAS